MASVSEVLTNPGEATCGWLTEVLRQDGCLPRGQVVAADTARSSTTPVSVVCHLEVEYTPDAPEDAPRRLFLKLSRADISAALAAQMTRKEVDFYAALARETPGLPTIRCYHARYSEHLHRGHLLLDDLSATHSQPEWPLPPAQPYCEAAMDSLAALHGAWWEHPPLGRDVGETLLSDAALRWVVEDLQRKFAGFADFLGDRLSAGRRRLYEVVLAALPRLWASRAAEGRLTLVHGDPHWWNFLYPRGSGVHAVYLIDWQTWGVRPGTDDVAYMIALHWYPERRAVLERALVRRYHDGLLRCGVAAYPWEQCWLDYRRSAVRNLCIPVWQWGSNLHPSIWWSHLERGLLAFEDLGCAEVLHA